MSLTKDDLKAIKGLIEGSEKRVVGRIDQLDDTLSEQMAHGLEEVHQKIDHLDAKLTDQIEALAQDTAAGFEETNGRIDNLTSILTIEVGRADKQGEIMKRMRKALKAA